ncbi:MAG: 50S ribosomal protein L6 [bacterium]|nr:50S ribosomal protein L6 [bacterium]
MSKIGQQIIIVPQGVEVILQDNEVKVKGKNGELHVVLPSVLKMEKTDAGLLVRRSSDDKKVKSLHGLYRKLIANAVAGVETEWEKRLEVVGTGFNVKMQGEDLVFKVGYSHPVVFAKVDGIKYKVEGTTKVVVAGADRQLVGQVAYQIKIVKKPDVYKGKGIRYEGERLRIKPGKKAKTA